MTFDTRRQYWSIPVSFSLFTLVINSNAPFEGGGGGALVFYQAERAFFPPYCQATTFRFVL